MGNIVDRALSRSIEKKHLNEVISECLAGIVDTEDTILVMTNNIL